MRSGRAAARGAQLTALLLTIILAAPRAAYADLLITPFAGGSFAPETTLLIPEEGAGRKFALGAAIVLLSDSLFGLEAEVGHIPSFFQGDDPLGLVLSSRVTTVTGNVILAVPLAVTRESLRPYVVAGLGLMQARSKNAAGLFPLDENFLAVDLGGGAIGFVTDRTGLRFDLRHIKAASGADGPFARPGISRLSFWRATVGIVLR
jgi:hypothetical protein